MASKKVRLIYWISTVLFVLPLAWSAVLYLTEAPKMLATMTHLGYPIYFIKILGIAKLLGVAALLYPGLPLLKEWAFAGFTFDLVGAFLSHLSSGDSLWIALVPLAFLALLAAAYASWKRLEVEPRSHPSARRGWRLGPAL